MIFKKKDFIVLGALVVIIIISIVLGIKDPEVKEEIERQDVLLNELVDQPVPTLDKPVDENEAITPTEFCLAIITEAQLREITKHKGEFIFTDKIEEFPGIGTVESCEIQTREADITGGIGFFPPEITYETVKQKLTAAMTDIITEIREEMLKRMPELEIPISMSIRDIDNIGTKAFVIAIEIEFMKDIFYQIYQIVFLEPDTNQVVGVMLEGIDYDALVKIAQQVEKNIE